LGGALLTRFYNRFEAQIVEVSGSGAPVSRVAAE